VFDSISDQQLLDSLAEITKAVGAAIDEGGIWALDGAVFTQLANGLILEEEAWRRGLVK
jgi:DNA-binding transcriptional regulator LsrR (DeoR family)